jgi:hypothetical protein
MIQHFVFFKFKESAQPEAIQQHLQMFAALPALIPEIGSYTAGVALEGEQPKKFDTAHYVTFENQDDLAVYLPHPAHQAFIAANKANWQEVLVVDSQAISIERVSYE